MTPGAKGAPGEMSLDLTGLAPARALVKKRSPEAKLRDYLEKRAEYTRRVAHLAAVIATWPPLPKDWEREMQACWDRLAPGGEARQRAERMIQEARRQAPLFSDNDENEPFSEAEK